MNWKFYPMIPAILALPLAAAVYFSARTEPRVPVPLVYEPEQKARSAPAINDLVNRTFAEAKPQAKPEVKSEITRKQTCEGAQEEDFDCYKAYYEDLVRQKGIKAAFADLRARYPESYYVRTQCHPLTHVIGFAAAAKFANVGEAYLEGDSFCWSGYYHGVLEGVTDKIGFGNLEAQLPGICASLAAQRKYSFDHYNCVHGLGHGIMAITNDELFQSLEICDGLADSWERTSCWSGAFMENIIVDNKNHFTKYLKPGEPLYPCSAAGDQYKNTCYLMQTSYMLKVVGGDYGRVFDLCAQVEPIYQATCWQSLGRDISGKSTSNVRQTVDGCLVGRNLDQQKNCVIGTVKDFISYFHSDVQARELCSSFTDQDLQDTCAATAKDYYQSF